MKDIPTEPHWAIISPVAIFVPGDQRSRDAPGHGYPEHYEEAISYDAYTDIAKWQSKIDRLIRQGKSGQFLAIQAIPQVVHIKMEVTAKSA
jgi:hypothetical protein